MKIELGMNLGFNLLEGTRNGRNLERWEETKFQMGWME